jgi:GDP-L-fucose synthase
MLNKKIYIAGHNGMVGSSLYRNLSKTNNIIITKSSKELDLRNQKNVNDFFEKEKPEYVFLCAAYVGGIYANNTYRADFIYNNLMIEANIIHAAYNNNVEKLLFLGSSCIYPKYANQPIKESELLSGYLEYTNEPYAIAKIAGLKLCESYNDQYNCNFISAMPTNLYGSNDNYDLKNSHVLPALIRKFHEAKINNLPYVEIWGDGTARREFMYVDDLAEALIFLMDNYNNKEIINVGTGLDITISDLAILIKKIIGYSGDISYNTNMPNGTIRKLLDISKLTKLGYTHKISLEEGILRTYNSYKCINCY